MADTPGHSDATTEGPRSLDSVTRAAQQAGATGLPPVHLWNPPFCGDIEMRIARDGTWYYANSPIGRPALVRLFSTILRKDPERFVLVTPVERVGIEVEDAPFLAVEMAVEGKGDVQSLRFRTNVDDWVSVGPQHPMRFEPGESDGLKPYVLVRGDLWALVKRPLFYDLVDLGSERPIDGARMFGVASGGEFYPMMRADALEASV